MTDPKMTDPKFARDLAFYRVRFSERQVESDALNDEFGFPRVDLAYAEAVKRARFRAVTSFTDQKQQFIAELALNRFSRAIGL